MIKHVLMLVHRYTSISLHTKYTQSRTSVLERMELHKNHKLECIVNEMKTQKTQLTFDYTENDGGVMGLLQATT